MLLAKISVSCCKSTSFLSPTWVSGVLWCGFCRILVRSLATSMAASAEDVVVMVYICGKFDCPCNALGSSLCSIDIVAALVLRSVSDVQTINAV